MDFLAKLVPKTGMIFIWFSDIILYISGNLANSGQKDKSFNK